MGMGGYSVVLVRTGKPKKEEKETGGGKVKGQRRGGKTEEEDLVEKRKDKGKKN